MGPRNVAVMYVYVYVYVAYVYVYFVYEYFPCCVDSERHVCHI